MKQTAQDRFYDRLEDSFWMGFGYAFGWAGYRIIRLDESIWGAYGEGALMGLLFFLALALLQVIYYAIGNLWESRNED